MLIRSIEFENFRQYRGKHRVEFSTSKDHSVTVILGQNTGGKTTFVRAFAWCLYGGDADKIGFESNKPLINENVYLSLENRRIRESSVSVQLEIEGYNPENQCKTFYRIIQTQRFYVKKDNYSSPKAVPKKAAPVQEVYIREGDANEEKIKDEKKQRTIINRIMPENLSQYFLFWGENIENISKKKNLDTAITSFTGLDVYDEAIKHFQAAENRYRKEIADKGKNPHISRLRNEIQKTDALILDGAKRIEILEKDLESERQELLKAEQAFDEIEKDAKRLEEKNSYILKRNRVETEISRKREDLLSSFSDSDAPNIYVLPTARRVLEELNKDTTYMVGWSNVTEAAIKEILKSGKCLCGQDFASHPDLKKHVEAEIQRALPNALGGNVREIERSVESATHKEEKYLERILSLRMEIINHVHKLDDYNSEIEYLENLAADPDEVAKLKRNRELHREHERKLDADLRVASRVLS